MEEVWEADTQTQQVIQFSVKKGLKLYLIARHGIRGFKFTLSMSSSNSFDLPWSLLRFQQRNGRIDRYGQDRAP